jgi:hypothetical protein
VKEREGRRHRIKVNNEATIDELRTLLLEKAIEEEEMDIEFKGSRI